MFKYADKEVLKYLFILMVTILAGTVILIAITHFFDKKYAQYEQQVKKFDTDMMAIKSINNRIISIKSSILEITAATQNSAQREAIKLSILKDIEETRAIRKAMHKRNQSLQFDLKKDFHNSMVAISPFLENLFARMEKQLKLLNERDIALENADNQRLREVAKQIRSYNRQVPKEIETILLHIEKSEEILKNAKKNFLKKVKEQKSNYLVIEFLLLAVGVIVIIWMLRLISLKAMNLYKNLETQLYIDALTGLYSRTALQKGVKHSDDIAIIIVDIKAFRNINELYGPKVGNVVLKSIADYLKKFKSQKEFSLYRVASDEFVLLFEETELEDEELDIEMKSLIEYLNTYRPWVDETIGHVQLEYSLGGVTCKDCEENPMGRADMALNYAKENNLTYTLYHERIDRRVELRQNVIWKKAIKKGISEDNFVPFFQKVVDKDGKTLKYETLMRLRQEVDGNTIHVIPFKFLDIAKKTNNYQKISSKVIQKSLLTCKEKSINITINLALQDMQSKSFKKMIKKTILEYDIAKRVTFEIVESENIVGNEEIKKFIKELRSIGVTFAIDDFGSGFSNFSFILEIDPEFLKIDGSLIKDITENTHSYELVKSIVAFAKELNITTIAEFVHSKEVFDTVVALGVDEFQGYYFHEPSEDVDS